MKAKPAPPGSKAPLSLKANAGRAIPDDEEETCDCCAPDCDCGDCERCSADVNEVARSPGAPSRKPDATRPGRKR